jgi:hypothetical protein
MTFIINPPLRSNEGDSKLITVYNIFLGIIPVRIACKEFTEWTDVSFWFMAESAIYFGAICGGP